MKTFETPFVDVVKFNVADVLTASGDPIETTEEEEDMAYIYPCIAG